MADDAASLSKGEQKRRAKQAQKEAEKAEKDAAKKAAGVDKPKASGPAAQALEEDEDIDPTKYFENRLNWVTNRKENGPDPYPHKFSVDLQLPVFHAKYDTIEDGGMAPEMSVSIAGGAAPLSASAQHRVPTHRHLPAAAPPRSSTAAPQHSSTAAQRRSGAAAQRRAAAQHQPQPSLTWLARRPRGQHPLGRQGPGLLRPLRRGCQGPDLRKRPEVHRVCRDGEGPGHSPVHPWAPLGIAPGRRLQPPALLPPAPQPPCPPQSRATARLQP